MSHISVTCGSCKVTSRVVRCTECGQTIALPGPPAVMAELAAQAGRERAAVIAEAETFLDKTEKDDFDVEVQGIDFAPLRALLKKLA